MPLGGAERVPCMSDKTKTALRAWPLLPSCRKGSPARSGPRVVLVVALTLSGPPVKWKRQHVPCRGLGRVYKLRRKVPSTSCYGSVQRRDLGKGPDYHPEASRGLGTLIRRETFSLPSAAATAPYHRTNAHLGPPAPPNRTCFLTRPPGCECTASFEELCRRAC